MRAPVFSADTRTAVLTWDTVRGAVTCSAEVRYETDGWRGIPADGAVIAESGW
ncbi:hypothetical protein ACIRRA_22290 [Nocardia sp. NPDC101769]|uniref:hypothetical protein n=1 Tax=Nocardia sp. NPDC101769 TaxID=3364333 RepID=UPI00381E7355